MNEEITTPLIKEEGSILHFKPVPTLLLLSQPSLLLLPQDILKTGTNENREKNRKQKRKE